MSAGSEAAIREYLTATHTAAVWQSLALLARKPIQKQEKTVLYRMLTTHYLRCLFM